MAFRITTCCENCRRACADLSHVRSRDEYWCDFCLEEPIVLTCEDKQHTFGAALTRAREALEERR
jgi:hypothetical protein